MLQKYLGMISLLEFGKLRLFHQLSFDDLVKQLVFVRKRVQNSSVHDLPEIDFGFAAVLLAVVRVCTLQSHDVLHPTNQLVWLPGDR